MRLGGTSPAATRGLALAGCGVSVVLFAASCALAPPSQAPGSVGPPASAAERADREEWSLLHDLAVATPSSATSTSPGGEDARDELDALRKLASYYEDHLAWDEFSAVRARQYEHLPRDYRGPPPGGPFPRIGAPIPRQAGPTVLGRWLNRGVLPELFERKQVRQRDLEAKLRAAAPSAVNRSRLADVLCSELRFAEAAHLYELALAEHDDARVRARLADVRRILAGTP